MPENFPKACSFSAYLPKFNPTTPKLKELDGNSQGLSKLKTNSVLNTSKITLPHGF